MATLADIRADSIAVSTYTDATTPAGTFAATAKLRIDGELRHYLLSGDLDDETAPILGRVDYTGSTVKGDRLMGGKTLRLSKQTFDEAYAQILAAQD